MVERVMVEREVMVERVMVERTIRHSARLR